MGRLTKKAQAQLHAYLVDQPSDRLVELLMDQVANDPGLRDRLLLEAAATGAPLDLASFKRSIADALRAGSGGRGHPRTSSPWARRVHTAIDGVRQLASAGRSAEVIEITEYALGRVDKAMGQLDDSSGWFARIVDDLEGLHHDACLAAHPDPVALARRLFAFEVDRHWDIFIDSAERYSDVLGPEGLDELRRLADARLAQLPAGDRTAHDGGTSVFHLNRMLEKLAVQAGDVDARVAVIARKLDYPFNYAEIAQVLIDAGRPDDALTWAEKGLATFEHSNIPNAHDSRLDDVVLRLYLDQDRHDDAHALLWRRFAANPGPTTYQRLRAWSTETGNWDTTRPQALDHLRTDAEQSARNPATRPARRATWAPPPPLPPYEQLIAVLLSDGQTDEAWHHATEHGCTRHLWATLAAAREADHPLDAIGIYRREVDELLGGSFNRDYEKAISRITTIGTLYQRANAPDTYAAYLDQLRTTHRAKTKFIRLLTESGLASERDF